jgi:uncharacterized DUF497 family protein
MHAIFDQLFEWDEEKNYLNQEKHGISFEVARYAFIDPHRIKKMDVKHSVDEERWYCIGMVNISKNKHPVITVRYVYRDGKIRIFGATYERRGRKAYEEQRKGNV